MIKFVGLEKSHWEEIANACRIILKDDTNGIVALDTKTGEIAGAVVCEDWTPTSVWCHIMIESPAAFKAGLHLELAHWVFIVHERDAIYGKIAADNIEALALVKHFGFTEIARLKEAFDIGIDQVIVELRLENSRYCQRIKQAA